MSYQITGKVINVSEPTRGTSQKTGNAWAKMSFVVETIEQYPKRVSMTVFGEDKIQNFSLAVGKNVTVSFDINAREYQGKWYNDINAFNVVDSNNSQQQAPSAPAPAPAAVDPLANGASTDKLPF